MPPVRRRNNLSLGRDLATTREIARLAQESAVQAVEDFVLAFEDFILNGISTFQAPTLQIKYYKSRYTRPQIFKDGSLVHDPRFDFDNGYYILKDYRIQIRNHLQEIFPQMTWKTDLGGDFIGITIANYNIIDDVLNAKKYEKNSKDIKDSKDSKDDKDNKKN